MERLHPMLLSCSSSRLCPTSAPSATPGKCFLFFFDCNILIVFLFFYQFYPCFLFFLSKFYNSQFCFSSRLPGFRASCSFCNWLPASCRSCAWPSASCSAWASPLALSSTCGRTRTPSPPARRRPPARRPPLEINDR